MPDLHFDERTFTTENTRFSQGCKWPLSPLTMTAHQSIHSSVLALSLQPQSGNSCLSRVVSGNAHSILHEVFADAAPTVVRYCSHMTAPATRVFLHWISSTVTRPLPGDATTGLADEEASRQSTCEAPVAGREVADRSEGLMVHSQRGRISCSAQLE